MCALWGARACMCVHELLRARVFVSVCVCARLCGRACTRARVHACEGAHVPA